MTPFSEKVSPNSGYAKKQTGFADAGWRAGTTQAIPRFNLSPLGIEFRLYSPAGYQTHLFWLMPN